MNNRVSLHLPTGHLTYTVEDTYNTTWADVYGKQSSPSLAKEMLEFSSHPDVPIRIQGLLKAAARRLESN